MWLKRPVAVDFVLLMQSRVRFAHIYTVQVVKPCLCVTVAPITIGAVKEHVEHLW